MTGALGPKGDRWRKYRGRKQAESVSSYKGSIPVIRRLGLRSPWGCFASKSAFLRGSNYSFIFPLYLLAPDPGFGFGSGLVLAQNVGTFEADSWCVKASLVSRGGVRPFWDWF